METGRLITRYSTAMLSAIHLFLLSSTGYLPLVPDSRIIISLSQLLFSFSIYLRQNTLCFVIGSMLNCFFSSLRFYLRQNTQCFVICSARNCFFSLSFYLSHTRHTVYVASYPRCTTVSSTSACTSQ